MSIQKIMLTVACILLIIALIGIGIALYNRKYDDKYPPVVAKCPDYWLDQSTNSELNGSKCANVKNLGKDECKKIMDFTDSMWLGTSGMCNKKRWAKHCNVIWDGITNTNLDC